MNLSPSTLSKLALCVLLGSAEAKSLDAADAGTINASTDRAAVQTLLKNPTDRNADFFSTLNTAGLERVTEALLNASSDDYKLRAQGNTKKLGDFLKSLKKSELETITAKKCRVLIRYLDLMGASSVNNLPETCRTEYINRLSADCTLLPVATIKGIPESWVSKQGLEIMQAIVLFHNDAVNKSGSATCTPQQKETYEKLAKAAFALIPDGVFRKLVSNKNNECKALSGAHLDFLKDSFKSMLGASCVSEIQNLDTEPFKASKLPSGAFEQFSGRLHNDTVKTLTPEQVSRMGKKADDQESVGKDVDLSKLSKAALEKVPYVTFFNYFSQSGRGQFGDRINHLPEKLFEPTNTDLEAAIANINVKDFEHMKTSFLKSILSKKELVEALPENVVFKTKALADVKLSGEVFAALAARSKSAAGAYLSEAANGTLQADILSNCDADLIKTLTHECKGKEFTGFELINELVHSHDNIAAILDNAFTKEGDSDSGSHLCKDLTLEEYLALPFHGLLGSSKKCRENLTFSIDDKVLKQAPELAKDEKIIQELLSSFKIEDWEKVKPGFVGSVTSSKHFAELFNAEIFDALRKNKKNLTHIPSKCLLVVKDKLTKEDLSSLNARAFSDFASASDFVNFKIHDLSASQLSFLPKSFFGALSVDEFKAFSNEQISAFKAEQLAQLSVEFYKLFTVELIKAIPASHLSQVTDKQVEQMSESVILAMSPEQITELGVESGATLSGISKIVMKFDDAQSAALKARSAKATESSSSSFGTIWYWVGGAVVAVLIAGVAVFFFMRK